MAQKSKNYRVRYDRIAFCVIILIVMILLLSSCVSSCGKKNELPPETAVSTTLEDELVTEPNSVPESLPVVTEAGNAGYEEVTMKEADIHRGDLILVNEAHPVDYDTDAIEEGTSKDISFVTIKSVLDTHESPMPYTASDWEVGLDRTAALAMDAWLSDFYKVNGYSDIRMIAGFRPDSDDFDFHSGRTLMIGIYPESESSFFYQPEGDYAWLDEHAAEYGFVVRYPEGKDDLFDENITSRRSATFRYVGIAPATYMKDNSLCLEEFLEKIKEYSIDSMLQVTSGDAQYGMYYIPAGTSGRDTTFSVPSGDKFYTVSGNNMDGFVITVGLNEAASKSRNSSPNYVDLDETSTTRARQTTTAEPETTESVEEEEDYGGDDDDYSEDYYYDDYDDDYEDDYYYEDDDDEEYYDYNDEEDYNDNDGEDEG